MPPSETGSAFAGNCRQAPGYEFQLRRSYLMESMRGTERHLLRPPQRPTYTIRQGAYVNCEASNKVPTFEVEKVLGLLLTGLPEKFASAPDSLIVCKNVSVFCT